MMVVESDEFSSTFLCWWSFDETLYIKKVPNVR
jgi:hypothetical protein